MQNKVKIIYTVVIEDPPKKGDILDIVIGNDYVYVSDDFMDMPDDDEDPYYGGINRKSHVGIARCDEEKWVTQLNSRLENYKLMLVNEGKVISYKKFRRQDIRGVDCWEHRFSIIAPNGCLYPGNRTFQVRVPCAKAAITGAEYVVALRRGEFSSDIEIVFPGDTQECIKKAGTQAKAFINSKIAEIYKKYETDPDNMSEI